MTNSIINGGLTARQKAWRATLFTAWGMNSNDNVLRQKQIVQFCAAATSWCNVTCNSSCWQSGRSVVRFMRNLKPEYSILEFKHCWNIYFRSVWDLERDKRGFLKLLWDGEGTRCPHMGISVVTWPWSHRLVVSWCWYAGVCPSLETLPSDYSSPLCHEHKAISDSILMALNVAPAVLHYVPVCSHDGREPTLRAC